MYQTPQLVRFGTFRELTLQSVTDCTNGGTLQKPWLHKSFPTLDSYIPGGVDDGCPLARS